MSDSLFIIDAATLKGTNCFIIGTGKERFMVDTADLPEKNKKFLEGLRKLIEDEDITIRVSHIYS